MLPRKRVKKGTIQLLGPKSLKLAKPRKKVGEITMINEINQKIVIKETA